MKGRALVLGRGAGAVRVVRACRDAGLSPVATYVERELDALHCRLADAAMRLDTPTPDAVVRVALEAGAVAVIPSGEQRHDDVARAVRSARLAWIGLGEDGASRLHDAIADAAAGPAPRRVAVDVAGDGERIVALGDRDVSLRRRDAALLERVPAPMRDEERARAHATAVDVARRAELRGIATIELAVDDDRCDAVDVAAGWQPGHAALEDVLGLDLVREAMRLAEGGHARPAPRERGSALALHVLAEDPGRGFLPSEGDVTTLRAPAGPGVRWHGGVGAGDLVPARSDAVLGTLVVHAASPALAIGRARRALGELAVEGVATTAELLGAALDVLERDEPCTTATIERVLMPAMPWQPRAAPGRSRALVPAIAEVDGAHREVLVPAWRSRALASR